MRRLIVICMLSTLLGCASTRTVTDSVELYPANASAQKWGVINFYSQYQSDDKRDYIQITLPNAQVLNGKMSFIDDSAEVESSFWDNVSIGVGVGRQVGHTGVGVGMSTPTYRREQQTVSINAYGKALSFNCSGKFNRVQRSGTVSCELTNGMIFKGTIRRVYTTNSAL